MELVKNSQSTTLAKLKLESYESARSELTVASLFLSTNNTHTKKVVNFISAAMAVCAACTKSKNPESSLDVLMWLRRQLKQEARLNKHNEMYRLFCLREAEQIENKIAVAFEIQSKGMLSILK
jgi:hypothetical protein